MSAYERRSARARGEPATPRAPLARRFTSRYIARARALRRRDRLRRDAAVQRRIADLDSAEADRSRLRAAAPQPRRLSDIVDLPRTSTSRPRAEQPTVLETELARSSTSLRRTSSGLLDGDPELTGCPRVAPAAEHPDHLPRRPRPPASIRRSPTSPNGPPRSSRMCSSRDRRANRGRRQLSVLADPRPRTSAADLLEKAVHVYHEETRPRTIERAAQRTTSRRCSLIADRPRSGVGRASCSGPWPSSIHLETSQLERAERDAPGEQRASRPTATTSSEALEAPTTNKDEVLAAVGRAIHGGHPRATGPSCSSPTRARPTSAGPRPPERAPPAARSTSPTSAPRCAGARRCATRAAARSTCAPSSPSTTDTPCSAVCVPVTFNGQALGVLHLVGPEGQPLSHKRQIERLQRAGDRDRQPPRPCSQSTETTRAARHRPTA